jgi:surfactin synthase thioesterase subunit
VPASSFRLRLFCFPFAGGGASIFFPWRKALREAGVEVCPIQLPGREARFGEALSVSVGELVEGICGALEPLSDRPFCFFGHSLGTVLAWETACELARRGLPLPRRLFMSGAVPPHRRAMENLHALPAAEFIEAVSTRYGGLPREVRENRELLELFTPILRADFQVLETYRFRMATLPIPVVAFGGRRDPLTPVADLQLWRELMVRPDDFELCLLDGGHFFLTESRDRLLAEIGRLCRAVTV